MTDTVGDALPREMARIRDKVMPVYQTIPSGVFALACMRHDLDLATKAMAEGDTVAMIRQLQALRGYEL